MNTEQKENFAKFLDLEIQTSETKMKNEFIFILSKMDSPMWEIDIQQRDLDHKRAVCISPRGGPVMELVATTRCINKLKSMGVIL